MSFNVSHLDSDSDALLMVGKVSPSRTNHDTIRWKRGSSSSSSHSEEQKFASIFHLFNEFEFIDSKAPAIIVEQAQHSEDLSNAFQRKCFEAIQFLCKKKPSPDILKTCCNILDKFTSEKSKSLVEYLRHKRWEKVSSIRPLDVFQEDLVLNLVNDFDDLIRNLHTEMQDWASRMLCGFIAHFYKCMMLYMYLIKEQDKELKARCLKLVLDQRRKGLKHSMETSIGPLLNPSFSISVKSHMIEGGKEFTKNILLINSDERIEFHRQQSLALCFFCIWSRITSLKRLSVTATVHSLMKLLKKCCKMWSHCTHQSQISARAFVRYLVHVIRKCIKRWKHYVALSRGFVHIWRKMKNFLSVCGQQDRVCNDIIKKNLSRSLANSFQNWRVMLLVSGNLSKILTRDIAEVFALWWKMTKLGHGISKSRTMLLHRSLQTWKSFVALEAIAKVLDNQLAQRSAKNRFSALKERFEGWKRWYLARWIANAYLQKSRATRALNAWMEYQILFIQKMITCATKVRFLRDMNSKASHFLMWKSRTESKRNEELTVVVQKMRIFLRVWNRNCGFGTFKTAISMTLATFFYKRWKILTVKLRVNRQAIIEQSTPIIEKHCFKLHFRVWVDASVRKRLMHRKAFNLIIQQRIKPALLHMYRFYKILRRIRSFSQRSQYAAFSAWKRLSLANVMFNDLAMKVKNAEKRSRHSEVPASELLIMTESDMFRVRHCFNTWQTAVQHFQKTNFLEMVFRCGEINVMRRHFEKWIKFGNETEPGSRKIKRFI